MENDSHDPSTQKSAFARDEGHSTTTSGPGRPRTSGSDSDLIENVRHSSGDEGHSDRSIIEEPVELDEMVSESGYSDDEETGLTSKERSERRRRKKRRTQLDARIAEDIDVKVTKEESKMADMSVLKSILVNISLIGSWYGPPAVFSPGYRG
jgi:hypothetical protein